MKISEMTRIIRIAMLPTTWLRMAVASKCPIRYWSAAAEKVSADAIVRAIVTKNAAAFCSHGREPDDKMEGPFVIMLVKPLPASHPVPRAGAFDEYLPGARNKRVSKNHAIAVVVATT